MKKIALESSHTLVEIVDVNDVLDVFCGNPYTSEDIISVRMKDGRTLFCDALNFDYVEGDYDNNGYRL